MMHPLLNIAITAARAASKPILRYMDQMDKVTISEKSARDFVTSVDKLSEEIIINEIQKNYPNHGILSEECGEIQSDSDYTWIIDPLDGTRNFMHGFPQFSISIAVMRKNQAEVGLIYDPLRHELFTATRGQGAYLNNRRIRVSNIKKMELALVGTGFPVRNHEETQNYFKTLESVFYTCGDIRRAGSAALDLAYIAAGRLDAFFESHLKIWDVAAAQLMIIEAGGAVTDFNGNELELNRFTAIAAGNLRVHKELISILKSTRE